MKPHHLLALLVASAALSSCAQTPTAPSAPAASTAAPPAARLAREMQALIGPAACTSDSQCHTVAVGAKACGGPGGYWAWSSVATDEARVRELAQRQSQAEAAEIARSGMMSNCAVVNDPGARCEARRCVLREAAAANAAR
ncbi:hypothetical protein ACG02S_09800 [Roseateles sp. DC23W]|uniref:DUF4189 domain-containing protein n=1 Tax=Pelomonas dachongensis TaxID=3299029 RepID=A0ABW7EL33_9BURK